MEKQSRGIVLKYSPGAPELNKAIHRAHDAICKLDLQDSSKLINMLRTLRQIFERNPRVLEDAYLIKQTTQALNFVSDPITTAAFSGPVIQPFSEIMSDQARNIGPEPNANTYRDTCERVRKLVQSIAEDHYTMVKPWWENYLDYLGRLRQVQSQSQFNKGNMLAIIKKLLMATVSRTRKELMVKLQPSNLNVLQLATQICFDAIGSSRKRRRNEECPEISEQRSKIRSLEGIGHLLREKYLARSQSHQSQNHVSSLEQKQSTGAGDTEYALPQETATSKSTWSSGSRKSPIVLDHEDNEISEISTEPLRNDPLEHHEALKRKTRDEGPSTLPIRANSITGPRSSAKHAAALIKLQSNIGLCKCIESQDKCSPSTDCENYASRIECPESCGASCKNRRISQNAWLNPKFLDDRTAGMKGQGLFAKTVIPKGTFVLEYTGDIVSKEEKCNLKYMMKRGDGMIDGARNGGIGRYVNHSCEPNLEVEEWIVKGNPRLAFIAKVEITVGAELTIFYNRKESGPCLCNTETCTGIIGGKE